MRRLALALPETEERESRGYAEWRVRSKLFVWDRPLRRPDLEALGAGAPTGPVLGAVVADLGEKQALLAEKPEIYFTTPHFDGYAAVLVRLDRIPLAELREVVNEAWLARAPARIAAEHQARAGRPSVRKLTTKDQDGVSAVPAARESTLRHSRRASR